MRVWGRGAQAAGFGVCGILLLVVCFLTSETQVSWQMLSPWQPSLLRQPMLEKGVFSLIFPGVPGHHSARCSLLGMKWGGERRAGPSLPTAARPRGPGRRSPPPLLLASWREQLPLSDDGTSRAWAPLRRAEAAASPSPHGGAGVGCPCYLQTGRGSPRPAGLGRREGRAWCSALPLTATHCPRLTVHLAP